MICKKIIIKGKVQGVCFRNFVEKNAVSLELNGYVKNLSEGDVEAAFYGDNDAVDNMIELCKKGPSLARVDKIILEKCSEEFDDFKIRY